MSKKTILIADDESKIRLLVKHMLSKDYVVIEASNGEEAIEIVSRNRPDLILMDIMMPKIDGYTACNTLKNHPPTSHIPIVMLTALGQELNKKLSEQIGASGYITKPFSAEYLASTIKKFV